MLHLEEGGVGGERGGEGGGVREGGGAGVKKGGEGDGVRGGGEDRSYSGQLHQVWENYGLGATHNHKALQSSLKNLKKFY